MLKDDIDDNEIHYFFQAVCTGAMKPLSLAPTGVKFRHLVVQAIAADDDSSIEKVTDVCDKICLQGGVSEGERENIRQNLKAVIKVCREYGCQFRDFLKNQDKYIQVGEIDKSGHKAIMIANEVIMQQKAIRTKLSQMPSWSCNLGTEMIKMYIEEQFGYSSDGYWVLESHAATPYDEDEKKSKEKRRHGNDHTVAEHLIKLFKIDVERYPASEYEKLCEIIESVNTQLVTDENGDEYIKQQRRFFQMFQPAKIPLDLFDGGLFGNKYALLSQEGDDYRLAFQKVLCEVEKQAGSMNIRLYSHYMKEWQTVYIGVVNGIYETACSGVTIEEIEEFYAVPLTTDNITIRHTSPPKSLFDALLFAFEKLKMKNDLRRYRYIKEHSRFQMKPLSLEEQIAFRALPVLDNEISFEEIDELLNEYKPNVCQIIGVRADADIKKLIHRTKAVCKLIAFPGYETMDFMRFICLLQCGAGASSTDQVEIIHYGVPKGKKVIRLQKIFTKPESVNYKESRLFLLYLMRRRYFLNILNETIANKIERFRMDAENILTHTVDSLETWSELDELYEYF